MKKLFALLLVVATLICCALPAYADDLENIFAEHPDWDGFDKMMFTVGYEGHIREDVMNPLVLSIHENEDGYRIDATYNPEYYVGYFYSNQYYTPTADDYTEIRIDMRIDGGAWLSEDELWGAITQITNLKHRFDGFLNEQVTFTILDTNSINEDLLGGPYCDILEKRDGTYTIDLTKHTIEVRHTVIYRNDSTGTSYPMPVTPIVRALKMTEETIPTQLPIPSVERTVVSKQNNTMSFRLTPSIEIQELQKLSHSCRLLVQYTVQGKTYDVDPIDLTDALYYTIELHNIKWIEKGKETEKLNNEVSVKFAYRDETQNLTSEWIELESFVQDTPDKATIDDYFDVIPDEPDVPTCGLCKKCSRPLNVCIWFLIPGCALMLLAVTGVIICIIKRKHNNTNKENQHA